MATESLYCAGGYEPPLQWLGGNLHDKQQFIVGMMLPDTTEKAMEPDFASSMALSLISLIQLAALLVALLVLVPILIAVGLLVVLLIFVLILVIHLDFLLNLVAVFPQR